MERPRVDSDEVSARFRRSLLNAVESWATANHVTRAEAVRRLMELGLKTSQTKDTGH